jgi:hypothetical protein
MASTVFEAVAKAKEFFELDFWKGPKPTTEMIYRVHLVADEREFSGAGRSPGTMRERAR